MSFVWEVHYLMSIVSFVLQKLEMWPGIQHMKYMLPGFESVMAEE